MYRENLPDMPPRIKRLPVDKRGYPIPWFVDYVDGEPDFRVMDGRKLVRAVKESLCWICGQTLGSYKTFVIGPMCIVNRTSAEPPSHNDCAIFAAKACPFLTLPKAVRREANMPEAACEGAGIMIRRNPGVTALWTSKSYGTFRAHNGVLFRLHDPTDILWFSEGRTATKEEILHSIETGLPLLRVEAEKDGEEGITLLSQMVSAAMPLISGTAL